MSTLQEFLIKSAGMEKEAKGAFRRLMEKGITALNHPNHTIEEALGHGMRFVDLSIPLRKRIEKTTGKSIEESLRRNKEWLMKDVRRQGFSDAKWRMNTAYSNYMRRVKQNTPRLSRLGSIVRKAMEAEVGATMFPKNETQRRLINILSGNMFGGIPHIPTLSVYTTKQPFVTTHHLADSQLSYKANKIGRSALHENPNIQYIKNPSPQAGWRNWRSGKLAVNIPGRPWSENQLKLMRESENLGGTPLYETVFNPLSNDAPRIQKVYVPDNPEVRKALDISDNVTPVTIDEIQSPIQGELYKGRTYTPTIVETYYNKYPLNFDRIRDIERIDKGQDLLRESIDLYFLRNGFVADSSMKYPLWFAPAARTSWGYMGAPSKLVPITSAQLRKQRSIQEQALKEILDKAQHDINNAPVKDLKEASEAIRKRNSSLRRQQRIRSLLPALAEELDLPERTVSHLLHS